LQADPDRSLAMDVVMPIAGRFYDRVGLHALVGSGLLVSAFSFWELSRLSPQAGAGGPALAAGVAGVGFGLIFVALSTAAPATIERSQMTGASGLYNVVREVSGSVGIAVRATQLTSSM
jgi:DHA2 family multidrug resistance protein